MNVRALIVALAAAGIPIAIVVAFLPLTWGYGGYFYGSMGARGALASPSGYSRIIYMDPDGPAYRAGVRENDVVIAAKGQTALVESAGPAGTVVDLYVLRNGKTVTIPVRFERFPARLYVQQDVNKILAALTAIGAFVVAILVGLRAREYDVAVRASAFLLFSGLSALSPAVALVVYFAWPAFMFNSVLPPLLTGAGLWTGLALLAIYPPHRTKIRDILAWAGAAALLWGAVGAASFVGRVYVPDATAPLRSLLGNGIGVYLIPSLLRALLAAQVIFAMIAARGSYRTPMRWLGGMWLTGIVLNALPGLVNAAGSSILVSHYGDVIAPLSAFCFVFGVAYPILRHRLIDLNIFVTRATVYAVVSAIIVGAFIAAEWAIGKIFEHFATQIFSLVLVLVLGISARSIHRFVEERLTKTFFRKRMQGLETIERLAHEADVATDLRAYMHLAVRKVESSLDTMGAAFYLREGDRYERSSHTADALFAPSYGLNDEAPLALRRWHKPFEFQEDTTGHRHHVLYLPMTVRGDLVGFLCCGPKNDRTTFLSDETAVLALLADRAGIASVLLSRALPAMTLPVDLAVRGTQLP